MEVETEKGWKRGRENRREGGRTGDRANSNDLQYRVAIPKQVCRDIR